MIRTASALWLVQFYILCNEDGKTVTVVGKENKRFDKRFWILVKLVFRTYNPVFDSWETKGPLESLKISGLQRFYLVSRSIVIYYLPLLSL